MRGCAHLQCLQQALCNPLDARIPEEATGSERVHRLPFSALAGVGLVQLLLALAPDAMAIRVVAARIAQRREVAQVRERE